MDDFPNGPPYIRFSKPLPFHPQIYATGEIECGFFDHSNWKPHYTLTTIFQVLKKFMDNPHVSEPTHELINPDAYNTLKKDKARYWRIVHSKRTDFR